MNLGEITEDYTVSVNVIKGNASATFTTKPAFFLAGNLYLYPFRHNEKIINFKGDGLSFELSAVKEGEFPTFWKRVSVTREVHDGEIYHAVHANTEGVKMNRRNAFRVFIGDPGEAERLTTKERYSVTIKDISSTGIAIIATKSNSESLFKVGEALRVRYIDEASFMEIDVTCRVVRVFTSDVGPVFGCQFTRIYPKVEHYVAMKQVKSKNR